DLLVDGEYVGDSASPEASMSGGGDEIEMATTFGAFCELSCAHRFGAPAYGLIVAALVDRGNRELCRAVWLPGQRLRGWNVTRGCGRIGTDGMDPAELWRLTLTTERFAHEVIVTLHIACNLTHGSIWFEVLQCQLDWDSSVTEPRCRAGLCES
ncbi:MAG: hypothetical protein M3Y89_18425, partial [Actinomycetota bacterium]|nr:hypothetical protein [Actinomycetota bacterium]